MRSRSESADNRQADWQKKMLTFGPGKFTESNIIVSGTAARQEGFENEISTAG